MTYIAVDIGCGDKTCGTCRFDSENNTGDEYCLLYFVLLQNTKDDIHTYQRCEPCLDNEIRGSFFTDILWRRALENEPG